MWVDLNDFDMTTSWQVYRYGCPERVRSVVVNGDWFFCFKMGTFACSPNRPCPKNRDSNDFAKHTFSKNRDFHRNSLHRRVPIESKPVYMQQIRRAIEFRSMINSHLGHKNYRHRMHLSHHLEHLLFLNWIRLITIFPGLLQIRIFCPNFPIVLEFWCHPLLSLNMIVKMSRNIKFFTWMVFLSFWYRSRFMIVWNKKGFKANDNHWKYSSHVSILKSENGERLRILLKELSEPFYTKSSYQKCQWSWFRLIFYWRG